MLLVPTKDKSGIGLVCDQHLNCFCVFKTTQKQNKHDNVFGCDPNSNVNVNNKTNVIGLVCDPTSNFKFQNVKNTHCQPTCVFLKKNN